MLSKELMEILACPKCKGSLVINEEKSTLECHACQLEYPVTDGIPELISDRARPLTKSDK